MTDKHVKGWPTSLTIREVQIKDTRSHFILMAVAKTKKTITSVEATARLEPLYIAGANAKMMRPLWNTVHQFLKMLNVGLAFNPAIPALGTYPREAKIGIHARTCT